MNIDTVRCNIRPFIAEGIDAFIIYRNNMDWMKYQGFKGCSYTFVSKELLKRTNIYVTIFVHKRSGSMSQDCNIYNPNASYKARNIRSLIVFVYVNKDNFLLNLLSLKGIAFRS